MANAEGSPFLRKEAIVSLISSVSKQGIGGRSCTTSQPESIRQLGTPKAAPGPLHTGGARAFAPSPLRLSTREQTWRAGHDSTPAAQYLEGLPP